MVDTKISDLTSGGPAQATDLIPAVRGATNVKITVTDLLNGVTRVARTFFDGPDFTAGISTSLSLTEDPGSEDNIEIYFEGLYQNTTEWTLITGGSPSVTFNSPIPASVGTVEVRIFLKN